MFTEVQTRLSNSKICKFCPVLVKTYPIFPLGHRVVKFRKDCTLLVVLNDNETSFVLSVSPQVRMTEWVIRIFIVLNNTRE